MILMSSRLGRLFAASYTGAGTLPSYRSCVPHPPLSSILCLPALDNAAQIFEEIFHRRELFIFFDFNVDLPACEARRKPDVLSGLPYRQRELVRTDIDSTERSWSSRGSILSTFAGEREFLIYVRISGLQTMISILSPCSSLLDRLDAGPLLCPHRRPAVQRSHRGSQLRFWRVSPLL